MLGLSMLLKFVAKVLPIIFAGITCCCHIQLLIICTMRNIEARRTVRLESALTQISITP